MKFKLLLVSFLALTACVPEKIKTDPESVQLTNKGRNSQPVTFTHLTIRVFENVGEKRVWIEERTTAKCTLSSSHFTASFGSPARVMVPNYGNEMPRTSVSCSFQGETQKVAVPCFFKKGAAPGSANFPRGVCSFSTVNIIFGK